MITIQGLDKLNEKLDKLAELDVSKVVEDIALAIQQDAQNLAPVDTGELRDSITVNIQGNVADVTANVHYAANVELGLGQAAQPFLTPAVSLNREAFIAALMDEIRKGLR